MVAHGTIAFDTLTTSDQIETGTEKSIDTSYLYNGTPKAFSTADTSSSNAILSSLNIASISDINTGVIDSNFTSSFSNGDYHEQAIAESSLGDYTVGTTSDAHSTAAKSRSYNVRRDNGSLIDEPKAGVLVIGELA